MEGKKIQREWERGNKQIAIRVLRSMIWEVDLTQTGLRYFLQQDRTTGPQTGNRSGSNTEVIEMERTDVKGLKPVEAKGIDLRQYEGQRVRIESAEVATVPSRFSNNGNGESEVLRVQSAPLATIQDRDGNDVSLAASELFNLTRGENGELGWPAGPNGKLANFLKKLGVSHPSELVGKEVVVRIRAEQGADGSSREFLGFVTD